jgi:hypothetical protein
MSLLTPTERPLDPTRAVHAYVSIGNSDGKLTHAEWAEFYTRADELLTKADATSAVYGVWHSLPATPYVNACWAVRIPAANVAAVCQALRKLAGEFRQDSVAFAVVAETRFLSPDDDVAGSPDGGGA